MAQPAPQMPRPTNSVEPPRRASFPAYHAPKPRPARTGHLTPSPKEVVSSAFLLVAVLAVALVIVVAYALEDHGSGAPASAATPTTAAPYSLTMRKYNAIDDGMTPEAVVRIMGNPGVDSSQQDLPGLVTVAIEWANPDGSNVTVIFQNGSVTAKSQYGLP